VAEPRPSGEDADTASPPASGETVIIKKYANRRLYNTASSAYVTLDHLSEMVRAGVDFMVQDAKTGDDITRAVLAQIIFEEENKGQNLLPVQFLRRLIRFYGDSMQGFLPAYLEMSMERFAAAQDQWRDHMTKAWAGKSPMSAFEEQAKTNMAMFEQAMRLWAPFAAQTPPPAPPPPADEPDMADLKRQMEQMQRQLDQLSGKRKP
jgi:polyhydroxyalkanoate synthesis repressor PhaR